MTDVVESLPDTIRIGPYDLKIEKWDTSAAQATRRWGEFSSVEQIIRIQKGMPTPFKVVDTFFHEAAHAIYWAYSIAEKDGEERTVSMFGTGLMALFRDNPWLPAWLYTSLGGEHV